MGKMGVPHRGLEWCKLLEDGRAAAPKTVVAERQLIYCRLDSGQQTWHT